MGIPAYARVIVAGQHSRYKTLLNSSVFPSVVRRLHLQGMTVPDYTVKVRKWFCVMCDEDYEGEKCCPRCGTGVYSRAWGRQEVPSEDARADNPLLRL